MSRVVLLLAVISAACASAGMGDAARKDVVARMQSVQPGIAGC